MSLDSDIDRLYQLPLEQFTEARNAFAARLRSSGRGDDAERVKALGKPAISAWAVNQLYWRGSREYTELVAAGTRLRLAQERSLKGDTGADLRGAVTAKERAASAALTAAVALLERAAGGVNPAIRQRIATNLEALAIQSGSGEVAPGRVVDDLPAPGIAALAALVPAGFSLREVGARIGGAVGGPEGPPLPKAGSSSGRGGSSDPPAATADDIEAKGRAQQLEQRARTDRARADLASAESEARAARETLRKASLAEHEIAVKADAAQLAVKEAKAQLTLAMSQATEAIDQHKIAKRRTAEAETAVQRAATAVAAAREALRRTQS